MTGYWPSRDAAFPIEREFHQVSYAREVIFGAGTLDRLAEAARRYGWQRLILCTSQSLRANGLAARVAGLLKERLVAVFDQVQPHVQQAQEDAAVELGRRHKAQAVIGLGGGSPIGMAKAISFALEETQPGRQVPVIPIAQPLVPVVAIPTTYAGSEMTAVYGITHNREVPPRKVTVSDPRIAPKLVIYDPLLTLDLNPRMTASSGINALAHAIEALYSVSGNPLSSAAAVESIRHLHNSLLTSYQQGEQVEARTEMLLAAHLAGFSLAGVSMGLHHGLCHILGGTANIPHGIANAIMLPHAVRFNAVTVADRLLPAAHAMGVQVSVSSPEAVVHALADQISQLAQRMDLLGSCARLVCKNPTCRFWPSLVLRIKRSRITPGQSPMHLKWKNC
jgi:maleylacetate reductase